MAVDVAAVGVDVEVIDDITGPVAELADAGDLKSPEGNTS